jgi:long-chain acyl-CoA synthetase
MRLLPGTIILLALLLASFVAVAQEMVQESSTGKSFPVSLTFSSGGKDFTLSLTGVAVRKKLVFKVYGMGHYMQDPPRGNGDATFNEILTDGKAKQITMVFVRDVDAASIQKAYQDGFKENSTKEELAAIQPFIDKFLTAFTGGVKENDAFILRWLPGGSIVPVIQGQEKPAVTNPIFARVLWTIWFGEDSIVDRDDLVTRLGEK